MTLQESTLGTRISKVTLFQVKKEGKQRVIRGPGARIEKNKIQIVEVRGEQGRSW